MSTQTDRRQFMTAAIAGPALWSLPGRRQSPNEQIQLGVVGIGIRGRSLLSRSFLPIGDFRVVAVCDVDTQRRDDAKRRVDEHYQSKDCASYVEYQELFAHSGLDAVVLATPDHWHANQILLACQARLDVYCEKPLTLSLREAQLSIEAARKSQCVFQTGSQQRTEFSQLFVDACERVRNGRIGRVLTVHVGVGDPPRACDLPAEPPEPGLDWNRWLGPAPIREYNSILSPRGVHGHYPKWRNYWEYAGGGLADMGAHHFDIAQWALKQDQSGPVRIEPPSDPAALRGATVIYSDGTRLVHGGPSGVTFIGTEGTLHVDRGRTSSVPDSILSDELTEEDERLPRSDNHAHNWLQAIRERRAPICDVEVGARSVAICHLLNLAYRHRRPLDWDPAAWRFVDDAEANGWLDYQRREGFELPKV
ncbi:MAG: putative dehydrogenase [Planctomycetota bacterium]|jgi:predicted dehydrogenase